MKFPVQRCSCATLGFFLILVIVSKAAEPNWIIEEWNDLILATIRTDNAAPGIASRKMALVHLAMFEAANSIQTEFNSYLEIQSSEEDLQAPQATIAAAQRVAELEFPAYVGKFNNLMRKQLEALGTAHIPSLEHGEDIADMVVNMRANDGSSHSITYFPKNRIGIWRRTPPKLRPPETPQWANVVPFCVPESGIITTKGPPDLNSEAYAEAWHQIKELGGKHSQSRSKDQTETAYFWACFNYTATPAGHWNEIACDLLRNRNLSFIESLRLMALMNLALADAGIQAWKAKYRHHFWRPLHAIRLAGEDGNSQTEPDPDWESLLEAPPHPEYVSGHSTFTGAGAEVLRRILGTDEVSFIAKSDSLPGVTRSYQSISQCEEEIGKSRIYGGIHFNFSNLDGLELGHRVGAYVCENVLQPLSHDP